MQGSSTSLHEVECQIAILEEKLCKLKCRRNALLPINQFPSEILEEIFRFTVHSASNYDEDDYDNFNTPIQFILPVSHVCHSWRMFVLHSPWLWSDIHVNSGTKSPMLVFILNNAGTEGPLRVVCKLDSDKSSHNPSIATLMSRTPQLNSITLQSRSLGWIGDVLRLATGRADNLESFKVISGMGSDDNRDWGDVLIPTIDTAFPGGTPNLRKLELRGCSVPLPFLQSTQLTQLIMVPAPVLYYPSQHDLAFGISRPLSSLIGILRSLPLLSKLHLRFPIEASDAMDFSSPLRKLQDVALLSKLESLDLSGSLSVMCAVLGNLRVVPGKLGHIGLGFTIPNDVDTGRGVREFCEAWKGCHGAVSTGDWVVAERLEIFPKWGAATRHESPNFSGLGYLFQWWDRHGLKKVPPSRDLAPAPDDEVTVVFDASQDTGEVDTTCPPWAEVAVYCLDGRFEQQGPDVEFPCGILFQHFGALTSSNSSPSNSHVGMDVMGIDIDTQTLGWSLSNLQILITTVDLPSPLWKVLSRRCGSLRVLVYGDDGAKGFRGYLEGELGLEAGRAAREGGEDTEATVPFPALRVLRFCDSYKTFIGTNDDLVVAGQLAVKLFSESRNHFSRVKNSHRSQCSCL
ncbi:hypothetical protein EST38_g4768 [Candolleomyces aberdarensis]|uniref:Uncharacterized protein n=1 Tax=Candolleomyces aberdarensis TaxID=2316362 RepID=A0A4V1Q474_9AGAR|nr:hypothetical protein EST38_g4768 [Candolleomyces aberdarensis]